MSKADQSIDLLNNQIGRQIGNDNPNATTKELAVKVLNAFKDKGLFTTTTNKDGSVTISQTQITEEQYNQSVKQISNLNNNALTQSEQKNLDEEKQKELKQNQNQFGTAK